jgi:DNA-binding PadR family transcriptional regulator
MRKSNALELAILGILHDGPLHGYELRKRVAARMGAFRAISFGALYPALKGLTAAGFITETAEDSGRALASKRAKITYSITAHGAEHLAALLTEAGPDTWDDDGFGVRLAFFANTESGVRKRILEGRRTRLAERHAELKANLAASRERLDRYTLELQRHGLEGVENELRWIDELLEQEDSSLS